jgi:hypothetical protein
MKSLPVFYDIIYSWREISFEAAGREYIFFRTKTRWNSAKVAHTGNIRNILVYCEVAREGCALSHPKKDWVPPRVLADIFLSIMSAEGRRVYLRKGTVIQDRSCIKTSTNNQEIMYIGHPVSQTSKGLSYEFELTLFNGNFARPYNFVGRPDTYRNEFYVWCLWNRNFSSPS